VSDSEDTAKKPATVQRVSVIHEGLPTQLPDIDPDETQDWLAWSVTEAVTGRAT